MACKLACINDLDVQTALAAKDPNALLAHATRGVGLHLLAWRIAFETDAKLFHRMPRALKTRDVCSVALDVDIQNFRFVPEDHRTDDAESRFLRAKEATRANVLPVDPQLVTSRDDSATRATTSDETRATSATTPGSALGLDTGSSATTAALEDRVLIQDVDSDEKDEDSDEADEEEEEEDDDDDESDEDYEDGDASEDVSDSDDDGSDSDDSDDSDCKRYAGKKHKRHFSSARKRPALSHITAVLSKEAVKGFDQAAKDASTGASAQNSKEQEALLSMAKRLAKVCMLSESGDTPEANQAKRKLASLLETANREVIEIYQRLTSNSAKPALDGAFEVEILAHGQPKTKRALWIINLANACAVAYLVAMYTRGGRCIGFYGHTTGAIAACKLFIDVIGEVTQTAENESFALGFANRFLAIQRDLKRARDADKNKETAMVVANNEALVEQAAKKLKLRSGRRLQAAPRDRDAYNRGQAAASAYSGKAKQPRLC